MKTDAVVSEIRRVRRTIEAECGNDAAKLYTHILEVQNRYRGRLVRRKPKRVAQTRAA